MTTKNRFIALDGLRGLAIFFVLLNHIDSTVLIQALPGILQPFVTALFSSGTWGVSWLFILSGFLMAYIYPCPDTQFLQKRYTRIFPLFVTMSMVMWVFFLFPDFNPYYRFVFILACAYLVHIIWKALQTYHNEKLNTGIFYGFIAFQAFMAVWYGFFVMRQPALWFQNLPYMMDELSILFANMTLTLPFGNYIPMLDGVYWSLAAEIYFYILYPVVFAPVALVVSKQSRIVKISILVTSFFFFAGLHVLTTRTNGFALLQVLFFYYFVIGIAVAYVARRIHSLGSSFHIITHPISIIILLFLGYVSLTFTEHMKFIHMYIRMLWAVPFGIVLYFLLDEKNRYAQFFRTKAMIFLGMVSYSLYLSHTAVIDAVRMILPPESVGVNILFICIVIIVSILLATCLYYLLELPYFLSPARQLKKKLGAAFSLSLFAITGAIASIVLIMIFFLYQSRFNLFSQEYAVQKKDITYHTSSPLESNAPISLHDREKLDLEFTAPEDRLGIVGLYIQFVHTQVPKSKQKTMPYDEGQTRFIIRMKEKGKEVWLAEGQFKPSEIGGTQLHPFGVPLIPGSQGKTYVIEMFLEKKHDAIDIVVKNQGEILRTVHQIEKSTYLRNPLQLVYLMQNKLKNVVTHPEVQIIVVHMFPFICLLEFITYRARYSRA